MDRFGRLQEALTGLSLVFIVAALAGGPSFLAWAAYLCGLPFLAIRTLRGVLSRQVDIDLLMLLAALGAAVVNEPIDGSVLLFLFSLSNVLEEKALGKTKNAIADLVKLRPTEAILVRDTGELTVPVEQLEVGNLVRVPSYQSVPVDGVVVDGASSVNQATLTGESVPVSVQKGDPVFGSTQNLEGALLIQVTKCVGDSALDRIVTLVESAQNGQASGERVSRWFGERYTWFVLGVFTIAFSIRFVSSQDLATSLYAAVVLLVALSPCALVISTPATTLSALAWAARNGILIRGGEAIERAGKVDAVVFDKTGTLTGSQPNLVHIAFGPHWNPLPPDAPEAQAWLRLAADLERYAHHPMARAIRSAAGTLPEESLLRDHALVPGFGVSANHGDRTIRIGEAGMFETLPVDLTSRADLLRSEGLNIAVMENGTEFAIFAFDDEVRSEASSAVSALLEIGVRKLVVLSGDREAAVARVARTLEIEDFEGALRPEDKLARTRDLSQRFKVAMVGDGVNDGPALASAYLGIAMGGLGSDVAMNSADAVLVKDRLTAVPELLRLGRKTNQTVLFNLIFATLVILGLTIATFVTRLPLPVAVIAHEGSTVLVILSGLRLLRGP